MSTKPLPDSEGHWLLIDDDSRTTWDVYMREDWPRPGADTMFATNEGQTDPCDWLGGSWQKLSDEFHGRLEGSRS